MIRLLASVVPVGLLLAGCVTTSPPSVTTLTVCPIIQTWTKEEQAALRAEIMKGVGPRTRQMASEWVSLRDQAKACFSRAPRRGQ